MNKLFAAALAAVSLLAVRYTQLVNVCQAMWGGWLEVAESMTPRTFGVVAGIAAAPSLAR